jgi:flagellar hook-associated protein FlgK
MKVAISINGAASDLVTAIGGQAERVNTAQTVDSAINAHSLADVQSVSYVILGEEASNPMQFQDAYYASARAMSIGFDGD